MPTPPPTAGVPAPAATPTPGLPPPIAAMIASYEELPGRKMDVLRELIGLKQDQPIPADLFMPLVAADGNVLPRQGGPNEWSRDLYKAAVTVTGLALRHVPLALRDEALCRLAVQQDGNALRHVPVHLRPKLYALAITRSDASLHLVPHGQRTRELCELALKDHPVSACGAVPDRFWDKALCDFFFQQPKFHGEPRYLPSPLVRWLEANRPLWPQILDRGLSLEYFPGYVPSAQQCRKAVERRATEIFNVPRWLQTEKLWTLALPSNDIAP